MPSTWKYGGAVRSRALTKPSPPGRIFMTINLDQPWLPTLSELAQGLEVGCELYDLYFIGDLKENHNFAEPGQCRCFPDMDLYNSLEGKPDLVVVTHKWTM